MECLHKNLVWEAANNVTRCTDCKDVVAAVNITNG